MREKQILGPQEPPWVVLLQRGKNQQRRYHEVMQWAL